MDLMSILKQAGFKGEGLKIAYAVAMAESGGNARSYNGKGPDNSYGLFQINMLGDMGPARRKQYGLSSNDDLFDPLTNAKIAFKMSNGGTNWQPWATYTGPDGKGSDGPWRNYYGGSGASITSTGSGTGGDPVVAKIDEKELAEKYGFTLSFLNANPEIKKIFQHVVSDGWTQDKFNAAMRNTKWWKTHTDKEKQYLTQMYTDPASAKQTLAQASIAVKQLAAQLGVKVTSFTSKKVSEAAYNVAAKGWSDGQVRYFLGQYVDFNGGDMQGQAADVQNELRQYAYSMGVSMSDKWYGDTTKAVLRGVATTSDYKNDMLRTAKAMFPQYTKQLDAGQSLADIAAPYMQSMAQILELPAGSINLFDSTIKKALQYKNPTTLQTESKAMWQFENDLRSDPRWKQTKNAQDSLMQVGHQVLADFGFKY